ncbi:aspartic peptidase domain-containing protein [Xylaria bambusicola]|uniref:aspartic peptidase domain-containing protein n=1 Tax=Xylaria bambusicola TaxID=326684 RepID=UPI002008D138|nr:aspartic peptidase domain-containing protein [Xylaria bambusicola]KAI0502876.1 aspartic peptidase domain-containing protein [Xylaria bambusicola]
MSFRLLSFLCLVIAAPYGDALSLEPRSNNYVKLPVVHSTNRRVFAKVYENKRDVATVPLAKRADVAYYAKLNIGTPPQSVYVQLDTGSFELWVNPNCTSLQGTTDVRFCRAIGHYEPSSSSSAVELTTTKTLRYGIGQAAIQYVIDNVGLAGTDALLENIQFGVALDTVDEFSGILGIGHGINVTIPYKNLIDQLADQGVTDTKAFSLALGSKSEQEGVIIFGGLDTSKFTGTLQTQPIIEGPDGVPRYWIQMQSLSITPPGSQTKQYSNTSMAVFLDSGATLTLLPTRLANEIAADFGAEATNANGFYLVDCKFNNQSGTLSFAFDGVTIRVPYREIVREIRTAFGTQCYLGISPSEDFALLGDTMLRSAYAVFDQTNNAIHLAQYSNCGSNEREITAQMSLGKITGDCQAPDLEAADASSNPVSSGGGSGTGSSDSGDAESRASMWETSGLQKWFTVWVMIYAIDFMVGLVI